MTTYKPRDFTFTFLDNIPENEDELLLHGVTPSSLFPGIGVKICVETNEVVDYMQPADFYAKHVAIEEPPAPPE